MMKIIHVILMAGIGLLSMCVPAATVKKPTEIVLLNGREEPVGQTRIVYPAPPGTAASAPVSTLKPGQRLAKPLYEKEEPVSEYQTIPVVVKQQVARPRLYVLSTEQVEVAPTDRVAIEKKIHPAHTEVIHLVPEMPSGAPLAFVPAPGPVVPPCMQAPPVSGLCQVQPVPSLYQVQLGAFYDRATAEAWRARAQYQFAGGSMVVFIPPYFKVRVGACSTRDEAEAVRRQAIGMGYYDAFIVGQ